MIRFRKTYFTVIGLIVMIMVAVILAITFRTATSRALIVPDVPSNVNGSKLIVRGSYVYLSTRAAGPDIGIYIVDISEPLSPQLVSVIPLHAQGYWYDFDVVGDRLYGFRADIDEHDYYDRGILHIYDISDRKAPLLLAELDRYDHPGEVKASSDNLWLHLWGNPDGIEINDISDPSHPQPVAYYGHDSTLGGSYAEHQLDDEYAYLQKAGSVDNSQRFWMEVYDISTPEHPQQASGESLQTLTWDTHSFDIEETTLYILKSFRCDREPCFIRVIDISDPVNPIRLGELQLDPSLDLGNIVVENGFAYASLNQWAEPEWRGIMVFDVRDPQSMAVYSQFRFEWDESEDISFNHFDISDGCVFGSRLAYPLNLCLSIENAPTRA